MSAIDRLREQNPPLAFEVGLKGESLPYACTEKIAQNGTEITFVAGVNHYYPELAGRVVILEKSIEALRGFLTCDVGEVAMEQGVEIVLANSEMVYRELGWKNLFSNYQVLGEDPLIAEFMDGAAMCASEYRDFGVQVYKNLWKNYCGEIESGAALASAFTGVPAVICGAGPSLQSDMENLRNLGGRALIFAGGSSMAPLSRAGVEIHFGGAVDPDPPGERFRAQSQFELPILYQLRTSSDLIKAVHGRKIWCGSPNGALLEQAVVGEDFTLDGGWVVSNFLVAMAHWMGCDPIITVGMDGCWSRDQEYVAGVEASGPPIGEIATHDREGSVVFTRRDLLWGAEWLSKFAEDHPHTRFINATVGGLSIDGFEQRALVECELNTQFDLAAWVHAVRGDVKNVNGERGVWDSEFLRVGLLCKKFQNALLENGGEISGMALLHDFELRQERLYISLLEPLWAMFSHLYKKGETSMEISKAFFFLQVIEKYASIDYS